MRTGAIDVAVIGGGPAGCATALTLCASFPELSVAILEAGNYADYRPGEILPPAARALLNRLGVLQLIDRRNASPSRGVAFAWGSSCLQQNDYFFSLRGGGWHLDRNRFDSMLATACEQRGVLVLRGAALQHAEHRDGAWHLDAAGASLSARMVVDATGRAAVFARMQGERIQFDNSVTSYARTFAAAGPCATETLVESAPHGWWYSAPLPSGRRVVAFMTDADLGHELGLPATDAWSKLAQCTIHIAAAIGSAQPISDCVVRPASTTQLSCTRGNGWLATGDASAAFDPLAAQGITKALRNGMLAAFAAGDALMGRGRIAGDRYAAILQSQFNAYRGAHRAYFARESRWSDAPFWARRQSAPQAMLEEGAS